MILLGEIAIVIGVVLAAVGVGLWVHPGAGLIVGGLGLALFGGVVIRFTADEPQEPTE